MPASLAEPAAELVEGAHDEPAALDVRPELRGPREGPREGLVEADEDGVEPVRGQAARLLDREQALAGARAAQDGRPRLALERAQDAELHLGRGTELVLALLDVAPEQGPQHDLGLDDVAMTSTWCSVSVRSRAPSPVQKRITRSSAAAVAASVARSDRSRISSGGASGPRARPPAGEARRGPCPGRRRRGSCAARPRASAGPPRSCAPSRGTEASACSNGGGSRCRFAGVPATEPVTDDGAALGLDDEDADAGAARAAGRSRRSAPDRRHAWARASGRWRSSGHHRAGPHGSAASTSRSARSPSFPQRCLLAPGPSWGRYQSVTLRAGPSVP